MKDEGAQGADEPPVLLSFGLPDGSTHTEEVRGPGGTIRVAVGSPARRSSIWVIKSPKRKSDVYVTAPALGGAQKFSLHAANDRHPTDDCRYAWVSHDVAEDWTGNRERLIEQAHDAAVADALAFIEREVLFTREGRNGVRQVETRGLIATAFTHRDSRAGDPDLHTHVAVANKVQTRSGKWLSIYGKVLHEHVVAASETYNTALERRLVEALGVTFVERPAGARGKRPVREIEGVSAELCERWSQRRASITARQRELAREFRTTHGRPPTPVESLALAQQANLETREAKHEPRSYAEQRQAWWSEAVDALGSERGLGRMVSTALHPRPRQERQVTAAWLRKAAECVITEVESRRATWQVWHVRAEAQRQLRGVAVPADRVADVVEWIVEDVVGRLSINLTPDLDPLTEPPPLRRSDGTSVYRHRGRDRYTSRRVLEAEQRIVEAAGRLDGLAWYLMTSS